MLRLGRQIHGHVHQRAFVGSHAPDIWDAYESTAPDGGTDQPATASLSVRPGDGRQVDIHFPRQSAVRWQAVSRAESAAADRLLDGIGDRNVNRPLGAVHHPDPFHTVSPSYLPSGPR